MTIFGAWSLHPKIPFPAAWPRRGFWSHLWPQFRCWATLFRILVPALKLFRVESERLELPAPFSREISESLDADAAGQATFHGCPDKIRREKGVRDGHIDLPNAALLAHAKLRDRSYPTRDHIIEPLTTSGDDADQARPALELLRTDVASR